MRKIGLFFLLLLSLLLFCSCQRIENESFDALSGAFACEYSYTDGDKLYRAKLVAKECVNDSERSVTLHFIEPETLTGIKCSYEAGEYMTTCGDAVIYGDSAKAFFMSAKPLLSVGKAEFCGVCELDGVKAECFKIAHENGYISIYVDGNTELPIAVVSDINGKEVKLNVISFERKEK